MCAILSNIYLQYIMFTIKTVTRRAADEDDEHDGATQKPSPPDFEFRWVGALGRHPLPEMEVLVCKVRSDSSVVWIMAQKCIVASAVSSLVVVLVVDCVRNSVFTHI